MATKDNNRITKDTSARKEPSMLSCATAKTEKMMEKLLLQNLEKECEERIEKLNAAHAEKVAALEKQVQQAAETGANKARAESGAQIAQRDNTIAEWQRKYENQGDYYSKKLLECEGQVAAAREETALKVRENNSLRRKVAIEINFKSKNGRVLRSYLRRPGMKFEDAVKELCKDIQKLHGDVKFFKDGQETTRRARTLGELGIKDKDEISFVM